MRLPVARSRAEALLWLDLHPCPRCGRADPSWADEPTTDAGAPARRWWATCPGCGDQREHRFREPSRPVEPGPDDVVTFGGPEPSELFDPGQWWMIENAALYEGGRPAVDEPDDVETRRRAFAMAVAAVDEILKFVPDGADRVPPTAFRTARSRATHARQPDRFTRGSLVMWRDSHEDELRARFGAGRTRVPATGPGPGAEARP